MPEAAHTPWKLSSKRRVSKRPPQRPRICVCAEPGAANARLASQLERTRSRSRTRGEGQVIDGLPRVWRKDRVHRANEDELRGASFSFSRGRGPCAPAHDGAASGEREQLLDQARI